MIFLNYKLVSKDYDPSRDTASMFSRTAFECLYTSNRLENINDTFFNEYVLSEDKMICVTECLDYTLNVFVAVNVGSFNNDDIEETLLSTFSDCLISRRCETTADDFRRHLENSCFTNARKILIRLKLDYRGGSMFDPTPYEWKENVLDLPRLSRAKAMARAERILASKSMKDELDRIYSRKNKKAYYGHPVHYYISAGDWGAARDMYELLMAALNSSGRLLSSRVSTFRSFRRGAYKDERYRQHATASEGGVMIIELCSDAGVGRFASDFHEFTKLTGQLVEEMKKDTLFIFVEIMGKSLKNSDALGNIVSKADIIQLTEGSGTREQAKAYLADLVEGSDISADSPEEVLSYLPDTESYTVTDIFNAYNNWYGSGLKNHIYKAYKDEEYCKVEITEAVSKPHEELSDLVGLTQVKGVIDRIISAGRIRCLRERMGLKTESSSLNMMFTGNPGTAKTTVARLIAQILKDEDIIRSGRLVECGRQDLVGKYVGWTARLVEEKFKEAEGGVLFIDEAYSLVEDHRTYGAEAINTITQLIENYRDRVIVIFAGYPDKMREFLEQNEGLRSRISFHLNFPDYSTDELTDILALHAKRREYTLSDEALQTCRGIFAEARTHENFGNGRYVRNLLEQAVIRQSERLINTAGDRELSAEELCRLEAGDICAVDLGGGESNDQKLGFAV